MKINGMVLYLLFRYASKNSILNDYDTIGEINCVFTELKRFKGKLENTVFEIKVSKLGKY